DEKLLFRSKPVDIRWPRLAFKGFLERQKCNFGAAEVSDAFAEHKLPVVMNARLNEVILKLIHNARSALLKLFQIVFRPPVAQASEIVELGALIVESMGNFVADHDANRAIVHGVDG